MYTIPRKHATRPRKKNSLRKQALDQESVHEKKELVQENDNRQESDQETALLVKKIKF